MRDRVSCAKVELPHNNLAKGDHISHEQEYNTGHGIPAISHEVRRKIRRQPRQSEIQQEPVVHLLLEAALGWERGIPCLSVQAASQPSKPACGSRTEAHPGHAPQKSNPGHDWTPASSAAPSLPIASPAANVICQHCLKRLLPSWAFGTSPFVRIPRAITAKSSAAIARTGNASIPATPSILWTISQSSLPSTIAVPTTCP